MKNFEDFQKLGQTNIDTAMKMFGEWNKGWQAIAAEMTDYTKRSFEEGTATFEKLLSAKSVEQAIEIQTRLRQARLRRLHAPDVEDRRHVRRARQGSLQAGREGAAERALIDGDLIEARPRPAARGKQEWLGRPARPGLFSSHLPA